MMIRAVMRGYWGYGIVDMTLQSSQSPQTTRYYAP
jgi:hypothetical protein